MLLFMGDDVPGPLILYKATMMDPREDNYSVSSLSEPHGSVKLIL